MTLTTRFVKCDDCGREVPAERRAVSDDHGGPRVKLVILAHEEPGKRGDLCHGTGQEKDYSAARVAA